MEVTKYNKDVSINDLLSRFFINLDVLKSLSASFLDVVQWKRPQFMYCILFLFNVAIWYPGCLYFTPHFILIWIYTYSQFLFEEHYIWNIEKLKQASKEECKKINDLLSGKISSIWEIVKFLIEVNSKSISDLSQYEGTVTISAVKEDDIDLKEYFIIKYLEIRYIMNTVNRVLDVLYERISDMEKVLIHPKENKESLLWLSNSFIISLLLYQYFDLRWFIFILGNISLFWYSPYAQSLGRVVNFIFKKVNEKYKLYYFKRKYFNMFKPLPLHSIYLYFPRKCEAITSFHCCYFDVYHIIEDSRSELLRIIYVYENQRSWPGLGFTTDLFPSERSRFSDETGDYKALLHELENIPNLYPCWTWIDGPDLWNITEPSFIQQLQHQYSVNSEMIEFNVLSHFITTQKSCEIFSEHLNQHNETNKFTDDYGWEYGDGHWNFDQKNSSSSFQVRRRLLYKRIKLSFAHVKEIKWFGYNS